MYSAPSAVSPWLPLRVRVPEKSVILLSNVFSLSYSWKQQQKRYSEEERRRNHQGDSVAVELQLGMASQFFTEIFGCLSGLLTPPGWGLLKSSPYPDATVPLINPPLDPTTSYLACTLTSPRIAANIISLYIRTVARKWDGQAQISWQWRDGEIREH